VNEAAVEHAARALYARMGGDPGYGKKAVGWPALTRAQQRPWLNDVRAVIRAYEEAA